MGMCNAQIFQLQTHLNFVTQISNFQLQHNSHSQYVCFQARIGEPKGPYLILGGSSLMAFPMYT